MANGNDGNGNNQGSGQEDSAAATERHTAAMRDQLKALSELNELERKAYAQLQTKMALDKDGIKRLRGYIDLEKELQDLKKAGVPASAEQAKALEDYFEQLGEGEQQLIRNIQQEHDLVEIREKSLAGVKGLVGGLESLVGINFKTLFSVQGVVGELGKLAKSLDTTRVSLRQTTGMAAAFNKTVYDLAAGNRGIKGLNLSMEESGQVIGGLSQGFSDLNLLVRSTNTATAEAAQGLIDQAALFHRLGVDAAVTGKAYQEFTRGLGMTATQAKSAGSELYELSQQVGRPLGSVVEDFTQLAPELARFGSKGKEVFMNLTRQARELGLSTTEAFNIAEQLDTFEGAADIAGKMNAQFGTQINSVQLLNASHEDRIDILRREFLQNGATFDQMGKRQKQMLAEIMGTDVSTAARLFGDPVELRTFQAEQLKAAERAQLMQDAFTKVQNALEDLFLTLQPVINGILWLVNMFAKSGPMAVIAFGMALKFAYSSLKGLIDIGKGLALLPSMVQSISTQMSTLAASTRAAAMELRGLKAAGGGGVGAGTVIGPDGSPVASALMNPGLVSPAGQAGIKGTAGKAAARGVGGWAKSAAGKASIGAMVAGLAIQGARGFTDQGSGADKALGVAGGALSGAASGAMLGSFIAPGIGTAIGGAIGGIAGGLMSFMNAASGTTNASLRGLNMSEGGRMEVMEQKGVKVIPGIQTESMLVSDLARIVQSSVEASLGTGKAGAAAAGGDPKSFIIKELTIPLTVTLDGRMMKEEVQKKVDIIMNPI